MKYKTKVLYGLYEVMMVSGETIDLVQEEEERTIQEYLVFGKTYDYVTADSLYIHNNVIYDSTRELIIEKDKIESVIRIATFDVFMVFGERRWKGIKGEERFFEWEELEDDEAEETTMKDVYAAAREVKRATD